EVVQDASKEDFKKSDTMVTIRNGRLHCPKCKRETPIPVLRRDRKDEEGNTISGLRKWNKSDFIPKSEDVFHERLYCVRYVNEYVDEVGNVKTKRLYKTVKEGDLDREEKVISLLAERFSDWQEKGFIPSNVIEE